MSRSAGSTAAIHGSRLGELAANDRLIHDGTEKRLEHLARPEEFEPPTPRSVVASGTDQHKLRWKTVVPHIGFGRV